MVADGTRLFVNSLVATDCTNLSQQCNALRRVFSTVCLSVGRIAWHGMAQMVRTSMHSMLLHSVYSELRYEWSQSNQRLAVHCGRGLLTEHGRLDALDDLDASLRRTSVATPNGIRTDCPFYSRQTL